MMMACLVYASEADGDAVALRLGVGVDLFKRDERLHAWAMMMAAASETQWSHYENSLRAGSTSAR